MKRSLNRRKYTIIIVSLIIIFIDQISKYIVLDFMQKSDPIVLIPGFLQLNLIRNYGAAFSLFNNQSTFLAFVSLIVSLLIISYVIIKPTIKRFQGIGLAFLLGGTLGNGLDRWILGYVNDFLELLFIQFPVFNFADISINIGVICIILSNHSKPKFHP
ncbi:signal peptidase II [Prochlorococcus marinus]|uniref:Lipoprotein signal peptidase n=1 Tax=Prochlorococcus marinus (strain MIT 9211) TaxID=93059 RepID=A9BAU0_PROM4|nr:signal peptidase II [Prochlorococcus marinus]ABX08952.1 putative lipoprotein signal peptidase [Prochlorococcus marinus str. MIT 9211]